MLIRDQAWREDNTGTLTPQNPGQFNGVGGFDFEMSVSIQFDKLQTSTQQRGRPFSLRHTLSRRAVAGGFTTRADYKVRGASRLRFLRDDPATPKLDIIRMRPKGQ